MKELDPKPRFDEVYQRGLENMNKGERDDSDVCVVCGHNIHEHEAVMNCRCYVYGCDCEGFSPEVKE